MVLKREKIERALGECEKHIRRIKSSASEMSSMMPLTEDRYARLNDEEVKVVDQFLFRFSKLQDAIGEKLFRAILILLEEPVEGVPFLDILNRMEKLELIEEARVWRELRYDRNELAHNYEEDADEAARVINSLYDKRDLLCNFYYRIKQYYEKRF